MGNKKTILIVLVVLVIIVIGVILAITLGKDENESTPVITSEEVSNNAPEYYGKIVENYNVPGVDTWRIYYADSDNIYLIADDYISKDYVPDASNRSITATDNGYGFTYFGVYEGYTGAVDIKDPVRKWLSTYLDVKPDGTNVNIRVIAYLLDTNVWNNFKDSTFAEYAVGAPTIELFCASYKDTHKDRYLEFKIDENRKYGYAVKWTDAEEYSSGLILEKDYIKDEFNEIYIKPDYSKAHGYLLASPIMSETSLVQISSTGSLGSRSFNLRDFVGLRPVVCLKSGVGIVKEENGNYILK